MSILQLIFIIVSIIFGLMMGILVFIHEKKDDILSLPMIVGTSVFAFFGATILFLCCSVFLKVLIQAFLIDF